MQTKIYYKVFPDSFGPPGSYLCAAELNIQIALPSPTAPRTKRFGALIDSGATRSLFHSDIAKHLGLDYAAGEIEITNGIGGSTTTYLHEVMLYLPGGPVISKVGFKDNLPVAGLLGMLGFFEFFKVSFDPYPKT